MTPTPTPFQLALERRRLGIGSTRGGGVSQAVVDAAVALITAALNQKADDAELAAEAALARNADNLTSGTVADARIPSTIARDDEVTAAVAAEATLARNADNLSSGTVPDARIASTIARDSEVTAAIAAVGAYQSYVPTIAQNGARTTSGVVARYCQVGKMVHAYGKATITNTGATANALTVSLPVAALAAGQFVGAGWIGDLSATDQWNVSCRLASTTTLDFYATSATNQSAWGVNPSLAVANGDVVHWSVTYEAA